MKTVVMLPELNMLNKGAEKHFYFACTNNGLAPNNYDYILFKYIKNSREPNFRSRY